MCLTPKTFRSVGAAKHQLGEAEPSSMLDFTHPFLSAQKMGIRRRHAIQYPRGFNQPAEIQCLADIYRFWADKSCARASAISPQGLLSDLYK